MAELFDLSAFDLQLVGYAISMRADRVILNTTRAALPLCYEKETNRIYVRVRGRKNLLVEAFHVDDVVEAATSGPLNIGHCQRLRRSGVILLWVSCKAHKISTLSIDGAAVMPNAAWPALPTWMQMEMLPRTLQLRTAWLPVDLQDIADVLPKESSFFTKDTIKWPVGELSNSRTLLFWGVEFKVADIAQTTSTKRAQVTHDETVVCAVIKEVGHTSAPRDFRRARHSVYFNRENNHTAFLEAWLQQHGPWRNAAASMNDGIW